MDPRTPIFMAVCILCTIVAPGQSQAATPTSSVSAAAPTNGVDKNYVLGPGDVISIKLLGREDFDTRTRISQDGIIKVPFLGDVIAKNKTADRLETEISTALEAGGFFKGAIVRVEIDAFASRYVVVLGEVSAPGLVPIDTTYTLSKIVARVNGVRETGADYVYLRKSTGEISKYFLNKLATGGASDDPVIAPGDKIYVPKASLFYMTGQVKAPGPFPFISGMNLRMAIGRAGGLTDVGNDRNVRVFDSAGKERRLNLDDKVAPGDVVVVGERLF